MTKKAQPIMTKGRFTELVQKHEQEGEKAVCVQVMLRILLELQGGCFL